MTNNKMTIAALTASVIMAAPVVLTAIPAASTFADIGTLVTPVSRGGAPKYDINGKDTFTTVEYGTSLAYDTVANIGGKEYFHLLDGAFVLQSDVTTSGASANPTTDDDTPKTAGSGPAASSATTTSTATTPKKVAATGKVTIYTAASLTNGIGISNGKILQVGTSWKTFGTKTIGGATYLNLGGDQYVIASATTQPQKATTTTTTPSKTTSGQFKITVPEANVRNSAGALTGRTLKQNSVWKTFGSKQMLGYTYYDLGGDQWVANVTGTLVQPGSTTTTAPKVSSTPIGSLKITASLASVVTATGTSTGKTIKSGSNWHVFGSTSIKGSTYYNLGGNQWVAAFNGKFSANASTPAVKSATSSKKGIFTVTVPAANVRNSKGGLTGHTLKQNSQWKTFGSITMLGQTYYNLGGNQYVAASTGTTLGSALTNGPFVQKKGTVTVSYVSGYGIQVWNDKLQPVKNANGTPKTLKHGTTWKTFGYQVIHDETYYNLGGNQWIDYQYLTIH